MDATHRFDPVHKLPDVRAVEWPTLSLILGASAVWVLATTVISSAWLPLGIVVTALAIALLSSLSHEVLHGHPFRNQKWNEALVFIQPNLFVPYGRFRDTHLAHHHDEALTDPYDDPESNYFDPAVWARQPRVIRWIYRFNNTLLGRILIGTALGQISFMREDWRLIRNGDRSVATSWALHLVGVAVVVWWVIAVSSMPFWAYLLAAYCGMALIKIRTFLEHRAHEKCRARTVIVEDRGFLAFLFLNNNFHVVHHVHPKVAWYRLPALYEARKEAFQARNESYVYRSYRDVFARYFLRTKDPVPHPLWRPK